MSLNLNNQVDAYFHKVYLLNDSTFVYEEVKDLIALGGSGGGGSANLTGYALTSSVLSLLTQYATIASLNSSLSGYTDTTNLNILLAAKQNNLTAGTGITLVGNTISSTHLPLVLQADGIVQSATKINFVGYTSSLTNNVLNLARMAWQDALTLRYSNSASDKNLTQGSTGELLWNGLELQLKQNTIQQYNFVRPITSTLNSGTGTLTIESLWMPSTITAGVGIFADSVNDTLGTLTLSGYDLRWLTNGVPTIGGGIKCLHFKSGFTVAETLNITTGQNQLDITSNGVTDAEMKYHIASSVWTPANSGLSSVPNPGTGTVYFEVDTSIIATNASVTTQLALKANDADVTTGFASVNFELTQKLESSLCLTAVPANMPFTTLVSDLAKISDMAHGASGVSLGVGSGASQRIACYEIPNNNVLTTGHYFYGVGLVELGSYGLGTGLGLWGGTAQALPRQNTANGLLPHMLINVSGYVGIGTSNPSEKLHVDGNVKCDSLIIEDTNGAVTALSRNTGGGLMWGAQDVSGELNKVTDMVDGFSGVSLGTGTGASQRIACYENHSNGTYFYGIGIFEGVTGFSNGIGLWGGSGNALPEQYGNTGGVLPHMLVANNGNVGMNTSNPTEKLHVVGNILCSGSITATSASSAIKSFDIEHPDPAKPDMRLRHWCVESDAPGGMVMYTKTVDMSTTSETFDMPDWFKYLTKNVIVFITPFKQFGSGWGECIDNTLKIHTTSTGKWNVLITADRNDKCATQMCPQEVEYTPVVQPEPVSGLSHMD